MRIRFGIKHLLGVTVLVGGICQLFIWEPWEEQRYRRTTRRAMALVEARLARDLAEKLPESWAGTYRNDDETSNSILMITPEAGWVVTRWFGGGCFFFEDYNFGDCELIGDTVRLIPWLAKPEVPHLLRIARTDTGWQLISQTQREINLAADSWTKEPEDQSLGAESTELGD